MYHREYSNCLGYAATALGIRPFEEILMPSDYDDLFSGFNSIQITEPITIAPEKSRAIIVSQNSSEGPFFPLHIAVIDPNNYTQVSHRTGAGTNITYEEVNSFIQRELEKGYELFFLF